MIIKILLNLFFIARLTLSATDFCTSQTPCKCVTDSGKIIDLTSVGSLEYPRFLEIEFEGDDGRYSYNPCFPFHSYDKHTTLLDGAQPCVKAAACRKGPGGSDAKPPEEHAIGLQSTAKFGTNKIYGVHINYTVPGAVQNLTVILICNNETEYHLAVNSSDDHAIMTLTSKCVCPNGCAVVSPSTTTSGLSPGSQLLIAFFTLFLAYFLVGLLWNFCNGAQGVELIPNIEFWNDLPKLILEGVLFTCSCFGRKNSYGEV